MHNRLLFAQLSPRILAAGLPGCVMSLNDAADTDINIICTHLSARGNCVWETMHLLLTKNLVQTGSGDPSPCSFDATAMALLTREGKYWDAS